MGAGPDRKYRGILDPCQRGLERALRTRPEANHPLLGGCRHRSRFTFSLDELRTGSVFVPGVRSTEDFDVGIRLSIGPRACDLSPLTRNLVVGADAIGRQLAGLPVHLHSARSLIFERCDQIDFRFAAQHAQMPAPVKENRAKVSGACRGSVSLLSAAATAAATAP